MEAKKGQRFAKKKKIIIKNGVGNEMKGLLNI